MSGVAVEMVGGPMDGERVMVQALKDISILTDDVAYGPSHLRGLYVARKEDLLKKPRPVPFPLHWISVTDRVTPDPDEEEDDDDDFREWLGKYPTLPRPDGG